MTVCECERSTGATLAQVLLLANSDEIENKIAAGDGRVAKLVKDKKPPAEAIEELYLATPVAPADGRREEQDARLRGQQANKQQGLGRRVVGAAQQQGVHVQPLTANSPHRPLRSTSFQLVPFQAQVENLCYGGSP